MNVHPCDTVCHDTTRHDTTTMWWTFTSNSANKSFYSVSNNSNDSYNSDNGTLECNLDTVRGGSPCKNSHVLSLRHCIWRRTKCDLVDEVWDFATRKWVTIYDPREIIIVKKQVKMNSNEPKFMS